MSFKLFKILFFLPFLFLLQNCGYQPLLTGKYQKFSVENFNISGNRKLGQTLSNKFSKIEGAENKLIFSVNGSKKRSVSNRTTAGTALEYSLNVNFRVEIFSALDSRTILTKNFSETKSYKASTLHVDTLNREKKIIDDIVKSISNQITNQLNLIYREE